MKLSNTESSARSFSAGRGGSRFVRYLPFSVLPGDAKGHHGHGKRDTAGRSKLAILTVARVPSGCGQAVEHRSRLDEERRRRKDDERKLKRR